MSGDIASEPSQAACREPWVRTAEPGELAGINIIVTRAVLAWPMAERVKRVALDVLRYDLGDFADLEMLVADVDGCLAGVAAWDALTPYRSQAGQWGALLHGLYVLPRVQRAGIGRALQSRVAEAAAAGGFDGLLVKSERVSVGYFERCGYERLSPAGAFAVNYPYLFWRGFSRNDGAGAPATGGSRG